MVENVAAKVSLQEIQKFKLTPCKICKPPAKHKLQKELTSENKAVGTSTTVRCKGYTKKGTRCKHKTRLANGFCFQHTKQNSNNKKSSKKQTRSTTVQCYGKTASGKRCRRKVKNGTFCYQHQ